MTKTNPRPIVRPHPRSLAQVVNCSWHGQWAVDFVIIDLERDLCTGIFLTLKLAKNHPSRHVKAMYRTAVRFFTRLDHLMTRANAGDQLAERRAKRMLDFPEAYEIRLGYAQMGSNGTGVTPGELRDHLFDFLMANPAYRAALTREPDTLCLIPDIGMDRASDIIATITKQHLLDFTLEQAALWQFDPRCLQTRAVDDCWNPTSMKLETVSRVVPVDDLGRVFVLVPKEICRSGPAMTARQYFGRGGGGGAAGSTLKERMRQDVAGDHDKLVEFVVERMKDVKRFRPRREFRDRE